MLDSALLRVSASLVLYKPDLATVERTLLALQEAGRLAKQHYALQLDITFVDNSNDVVLYGDVDNCLDSFRARVPDWNAHLVR